MKKGKKDKSSEDNPDIKRQHATYTIATHTIIDYTMGYSTEKEMTVSMHTELAYMLYGLKSVFRIDSTCRKRPELLHFPKLNELLRR